MHKIAKTLLALIAGIALALGVPLAANAASVSAAPSSSIVQLHNDGKGGSHPGSHDNGKHIGWKNPHNPHNPYVPTPAPTPTFPAGHHHPRPFWWGGYWWFPFNFGPHSFHPGSVVHVHFNGFGFNWFGTFQATASQDIVLGTAAADGSLTAQVKASGAKTLAGQTVNATVADTAGTTVSQSIAVPADAVKASTSSTSIKAADPKLAATGTYMSIATIWGAVGLVALGAGFVAMQTVIRRKDRAKA